jgi:hypothetical protein
VKRAGGGRRVMRLRTGMQLTDLGLMGMERMVDTGRIGTDRKDRHRKGTCRTEQSCERRSGTGD